MIDLQEKGKLRQYYGEGLTFLLLLVVGAWGVYRLMKREFLLYQQEQHFLLGFTRELKTPISVVSLNLETLLKRKCSEEVAEQLILYSLKELKRLNFFYDNILTSARLKEKNKYVYFERFDLGD